VLTHDGRLYLYIAVPAVYTFGTAEKFRSNLIQNVYQKVKDEFHSSRTYIYLFIYLPVFMVCLRKFSVNLDKDITMCKKIGEEMKWHDI
jgi:hypothetical protein